MPLYNIFDNNYSFYLCLYNDEFPGQRIAILENLSPKINKFTLPDLIASGEFSINIYFGPEKFLQACFSGPNHISGSDNDSSPAEIEQIVARFIKGGPFEEALCPVFGQMIARAKK